MSKERKEKKERKQKASKAMRRAKACGSDGRVAIEAQPCGDYGILPSSAGWSI